LVDGVDASIITPNDPKALSQAITKLLSDPAAAAVIAEAGFQRYLATCTPEHMVRPIEQRLASLVTRTPSVQSIASVQ
jgi:hypothetical protein